MHGLSKFHEQIGCSTPDRRCEHEGVCMQTIVSKMRSSTCQASMYSVCGLCGCQDGRGELANEGRTDLNVG